MSKEEKYKEIKIPINWALGGYCPKCGYRLVKYSLNYECARCDFKVPKNSELGKTISYKVESFGAVILNY